MGAGRFATCFKPQGAWPDESQSSTSRITICIAPVFSRRASIFGSTRHWWLEGHIEGVTGWSIGHDENGPGDPAVEAASLYEKLESVIVPTFYGRPDTYRAVMVSAIAFNGSFFNTQRMLRQYAQNAYGIEC